MAYRFVPICSTGYVDCASMCTRKLKGGIVHVVNGIHVNVCIQKTVALYCKYPVDPSNAKHL